MKDRIVKLMKSENLSPSQLADNLGVQRSGVSHIISGRNNPGLDFIQRILKYYPNINPDWLLLNKGPMYRNGSSEQNENDIIDNEISAIKFELPEFNNADVVRDAEQITVQNSEINTKKEIQSNFSIPPKSVNKETDKIIILYKDGSFDIYQ